jgi:hypothetical protein
MPCRLTQDEHPASVSIGMVFASNERILASTFLIPKNLGKVLLAALEY